MEIKFDPKKNEANIKKHGIALNEAGDLDWETALVMEDNRFHYSEQRFMAIGLIQSKLHVVCYTLLANDAYRVFSLRMATKQEKRFYEKYTTR